MFNVHKRKVKTFFRGSTYVLHKKVWVPIKSGMRSEYPKQIVFGSAFLFSSMRRVCGERGGGLYVRRGTFFVSFFDGRNGTTAVCF